jgi:fluoroacetyl-CoA thioesterase
MKNPFQPGDTQTYHTEVRLEDRAAFHGKAVHNVYSTFAVARDAEWTCRLFVLAMKEAGEEGVGVEVTVQHHAPAKVGEQVTFVATLEAVEGRTVRCHYTAHVGSRLVATGTQTQKVLDKARFDASLKALL